MKTRMLLFACLILFLCNDSYAQTWQWTHPEPNGIIQNPNTFPSDIESDLVHDIEKDSSGNIYVLGDYYDSLYLSNVLRTADTGNVITHKGSFLAKYNSSGTLLWYQLVKPIYISHSYMEIRATAICVNKNGVFITGVFTGGSPYGEPGIHQVCNYQFTTDTMYNTGHELFLAKLNSSNGNVVWFKQSHVIAGQNGYGEHQGAIEYEPVVTSDKKNNVILGFDVGTVDTVYQVGSDIIPIGVGIDDYSIALVKYNSAGNLVWSNYATKTNNSNFDVTAIASDNKNNIFIYGFSEYGSQFGSIVYQPTNHDSYSTFLAKVSSTGSWSFAQELAHSTDDLGTYLNKDNPHVLAIDNSNNVYTLLNPIPNDTLFGNGTIATIPYIYLAKFNNNGILQWYKNFGNKYTYADEGRGIYYSNSNLYITGALRYATGPNDYSMGIFSQLYVPTADVSQGNQYFVGKMDLNGNFVWVNSFAADEVAGGFAICANNDDIYTGGFYSATITTLGNLNGTFSNNDGSILNLFFGKLKDQYIKIGAVTPTSICAGSNITIPFISTGLNFSSANTFTAELSDASGSFDSPVAIGSAVSTGTGNITATLPTTLAYGSTYIVRIKSSDTLKTGYNYYAYADTNYKITITCPPPITLSTTNITGTTATFNWASTACGAKYKIQKRLKGVTTWQNVTVGSTATSYTATGLTPNKAYQWKIASICQVSPQIISAYSPIQNFTTASSLVAAIKMNSDISAAGLEAAIIPNPVVSNSVVVVKGNRGTVNITLTDVSGKLVWKSAAVNDNQINISMQSFAKGTYFLTVQDGYESKVLKLVKAD